MQTNDRHFDDPHFDDPTKPGSLRSAAQLRRNRKSVSKLIKALLTVEPRLELEELVNSLAGLLPCHQKTARLHIASLTGRYDPDAPYKLEPDANDSDTIWLVAKTPEELEKCEALRKAVQKVLPKPPEGDRPQRRKGGADV